MKSLSGSNEIDAPVFSISFFKTERRFDFNGHHASSRTTVKSFTGISLGDGGGTKSLPWWPRGRGNEQAAGAGDRGHDEDRGLR